MRAVWDGGLPPSFVVRDVQQLLPELAYTTVMTTVNRLAEKGMLRLEQIPRQKAYRYGTSGTPEEFLTLQSRAQVDRLVDRYGDAALAAFAAHFEELPAEQRRRLRKLLGE